MTRASLVQDHRFKNSVVSGTVTEGDHEIEGLINDYRRVVEFAGEQPYFSINKPEGGVQQHFYENEFDAPTFISGKSGTYEMPFLDIDRYVAPLSSRQNSNPHLTRQRTLTPLSEWEGYVESILDDAFIVRMVNIRSKTNLPDEDAVFSKADLSRHQREMLREGAIVRWVVGLERLPNDQRRRVSELHFRRLPAHTKRDFDRALQKAEALLEALSFDDSASR